MIFEHIQTTFEVDEKNYLGFYEASIFKYSSENVSLENILKTDMLSEQRRPSQFGPFTIRLLSANDFIKLNFVELKETLKKLFKKEDWGEDLEVVKNYVTKVFKKIDIENDEIYYISWDSAQSKIEGDFKFFTYFIGLICVNPNQKSIKKIYFGGD